MALKLQDLKAEGTSITRYTDSKLIIKSYGALVLWGPHIGIWERFASKHMSHKLIKTTYARHVKLSVCFTSDEFEIASGLKGQNVNHCKAIFALAYNEALTKVPEWALKEIRRWTVDHRMLVAQYLYYMGEQGIPLLTDLDCSYQLELFKLLMDIGRPQAIRHMYLPRRKQAMRRIFPRITAQARNQIMEVLNRSNSMRVELVRDRAITHAHVRPLRLRAYHLSYTNLKCMLEYGRTQHRNPFSHSYLIDSVNTPVATKVKEMLWDWAPDTDQVERYKHAFMNSDETPEFCALRYPVDLFSGIQNMVNALPENQHLLEEALATRTCKQMQGVHQRLQQLMHADNELRERDYAAWLNKRDGDLLHNPWPEWKGPALPSGITHLNNYELLQNEGKSMHHCVGGYARQAYTGKCWLFHVEYQGETATAELDPAGKYIKQMYGPCNNPVSHELNTYVTSWLKS